MSLRFTGRLALVAALVAVASSAFAADIVNRKTVPRVAGKITGGSKTELTVKPPTGDAVSVPANDIASVEWDDATADLKLGLSDENGGRFDSALQRIAKSKSDSSGAGEQLKLEFDFLIARVTARQALSDPARRTDALKLLDAFQKSGGNHFRFYEAVNWLGQVQLAAKDYAAARKTFETLAQAPWNDVKLSAQIANGRILMGEDKPEEAVREFDAAIAAAGDSPADKARRYEAMLGKARALILQSRHEAALADLEEVTTKAPVNDTPVQAEAYVLQGNALMALNRNKEAVLAYLHVDILFPRESAFHAESLYQMARLWKTVQAPERGLDAEAKLQSAYPNSEWTKRLAASPATE
jgi:tetratricopeptide (TPR) repeat protein